MHGTSPLPTRADCIIAIAGYSAIFLNEDRNIAVYTIPTYAFRAFPLSSAVHRELRERQCLLSDLREFVRLRRSFRFLAFP